MKRLFTLLTALMLATALCAPVLADDAAVTDPTPDPTPTPTASIDTTNSDGVYVSAYTVTNAAGGEVTTVEVGDRINLVLKVVDHASARYCIKPEEISARINSAVFTYTGIGEIGQLFDNNDDPNATRLQNVRNGSATAEEIAQNAQYNYYSYVLLFRDVIYNGGGNTVPINLSYLDTSKPLQQFSVTIGQCVDKDQTTSPNLLVRTSSYGDSVIAGTPFTLSLGLYATDGNENLNDVIVSLTLPENILLNSGSLSNYVGTIAAKQTRDVTFEVMPSAGFTGTVANITVNMTGTGSITGKEVSGTTTISVPVSQPNRFEVGQLELSSDTIYVGDTGSVSLTYVNKGKNPVSNLEARLTGTNLGAGSYQYLGNLNAGTEGSVDFDITPDAAGTVTLAFTASDGALTSEVYTVTLHVNEIGHAYPFEFKGLHSAQLSDIKVYTYTDGVKGKVDVSEMMGSSVHLHVTAEGKDVIVIVPTNGAAAHFPAGSEVNMIFGGNVAHVFSKETEKNLEW